jgi:cellulose synthase/poly-beta-1,6-N-acetylglucosamine synthase-like glycosyltransferase
MIPPYSLVIATLDRPSLIDTALAAVAAQTHLPAAVIVVDASAGTATADVCARWSARLPLHYEKALARSAARQRNQGAARATTPLVGFMDDDIVPPPDTLQKLAETFADERVGGVAGRILGFSHPVPRGLLWWYYRWQAGYAHPHYGGRVIGPAINFLPAFDLETAPLIPAEWLNSGLVLYRREVFAREQFPAFEGYSFLEDAHLSYRVGRTHRLFFRGDAPYGHNDPPATHRPDQRALARMRIRHQQLFARELLGLSGFTLFWKLTLHRLFQTLAVLRSGAPGRWRTITGFWGA